MAIIKCPECGHQVSDRAPVCPSCGVEIAGNINRCTRCGEVYFRYEHFCPNCHQPSENNHLQAEQKQEINRSSSPDVQGTAVPADAVKSGTISNKTEVGLLLPDDDDENSKKKKKNFTPLIVSFILALLTCGVLIYSYSNAKARTEVEEYEFAMKSSDPTVLQQYLDNFIDAPKEHRDSIMAHLDRLKKVVDAWNYIAKSTNREEIIKYIEENPNSPHRDELVHRLDSIDWASASEQNTVESYQRYIDEHPTGEHYDEAQQALNKQKAKELSPEDRQMISRVFRTFFLSINTKNEAELTSTVAEVMSSFLGRTNASKGDVIDYMNRSYKDGITGIVWRLNNDYKITKHEIGEGDFEYVVKFTAEQDVMRGESVSDKNRYSISARVNPDGLISEMAMSKSANREE
ncbi:MAG: zinc ribbon domain-containing protein [Prevotella sp.]|uniref:zinc ribbon domain-containing protein n=1 Tax=Prevotella sp. TaxID=59823 RepID=UPI002A2AF834|nr:zinc ribbon domain-containing protein [Prevotella sp.]MDD7318139.1 zinc ribbon domain-containing protein [Prevotellaceae bacterium]MDY4020972.1 zinc ribbon domain-containing protein [Prevotella sp.]